METHCIRLFTVTCVLILACRIEVFAVKFPICEDSPIYAWRTTEWGSCFSPSGCGFGHRERNVTCSDSGGRIQHETKCISAAKPAAVEECFKTCDEIIPHLRWVVGRWSQCIPTRPLPSSCQFPISGISQREVHCLFADTDGKTKKVDNAACRVYWKQPDSVASCSFECPQDCVVADYAVSPYSCNESYCDGRSEFPHPSYQKVVVAPETGGKRCPKLQSDRLCGVEKCYEAENFTEEYILKTGNWGPCIPLYTNRVLKTEFLELGIIPKLGITKRTLSCLNSRGEEVNMSLCRPLPEWVGEQKCLVPVDCELSPWTEWKVLKEGCMNSVGIVTPEMRARRRQLVVPPMGGGTPCGVLVETRDVIGNLKPCTKYKWLPLEWSDCVVYTHGPSEQIHVQRPTCGGGVHSRNITCLRVSDLVPVNDSFCSEPKPPVVERCEIACIRDCQVSQWSRWSRCMPSKNVSDMFRPLETGYRKRTRSVIASPASGGAPCPHLEEMDTCWEAELSEWRYGNWSECILEQPSTRCGPGAMTRDYTCVSWRGERLGEFFCRLHVPPMVTVEECRIPCPNDCLYTEWSDWSTCSRSCSSGESDGIMTRNRTVLAVQGPGGEPCFGGRKHKEFCNWHSCTPYHWEATPWSKCRAQQHDKRAACGEGVQERQVYCTIGKGVRKDDSFCMNLQRPPDVQRCHVPCPQDCIVTEFTEWTSCPPGCYPGSYQVKERFVVKSAKHGGKPCPEPLREKRPCLRENEVLCPAKRYRTTYRWLIEKWSDCILPSGKKSCGVGFHIRNVTCIDPDGFPVEIHNCMTDSLELTDFSVGAVMVPITFQLCQITCKDGKPSCSLSTWSQWSHCRHRFRAKRYRTRELIGHSYRDPDCKARFSLIDEQKCPFIPSLTNDEAPWNSCILDTNTSSSAAINDLVVPKVCGSGYKYRAGLQLEGGTGFEPGLERDVCLVECPIDCEMSTWSSWSECDVPCGQGYRTRERKVVVQGNPAGRPCPPGVINGTEIQTEICGVPCSEFRWLAYGWSPCQLEDTNSSLPCGHGIQARIVRCIEKRREQVVSEHHCDSLYKPDSSTNCTVYCPGDCVVSTWVTWKKCSQPCSSESFLEMRRRVLRQPGPSGKPCPQLIRKSPCVLNSTCFEHSWHVRDWGSCVLPEGAFCGEGVQRRALVCLRSDGRQVDSKECGKDTEFLKQPMSKPCYVDCPIDCVVSEWTEWNRERCYQCGTSGLMRRSRIILQPASDAGQPCPQEMEQIMACPFRPCFYWNISDWSECDLQDADCGFGVRRRLIRCFRYDGLQVDKIHCLVANLTFDVKSWLDTKWLTLGQSKAEEEECYVSCPGDCHLSEWSEWSHCHKDCLGGQKIGYQTSSRVVLTPKVLPESECSQKRWRTRPCWGYDCQGFRWSYKNKTLVCEREDGLVVRGGCTDSPRPCLPDCEDRLGGRCDGTKGLCYCLRPNGRRLPIADVHSAKKCETHTTKVQKNPKRPANHTAPTPEIQLKYYPDDSQVSLWMYAMISIGTAFVIFVAATMYLMCRSSIRRRMASVQRQGSVRRRCLHSSREAMTPNAFT